MKNLLPAILSLAALCGAHALPGPFTATISIPSQVPVGQDVPCKVTFTNHHHQDYLLLKRRTPLDRLEAPIFSITHNGKALPYEGLLARKTPPTRKDFIAVPAKSSVASTLDLSLAYGFRVPGMYSIQLSTGLYYSTDGTANISRQLINSKVEVLTLVESRDEPKLTKAEIDRKNFILEESPTHKDLDASVGALTPAFNGRRTSSDESTAKIAYAAAYGTLGKSASSVVNNPTLYTKWFGRSYNGYKDTVKGNYLDMKYFMENYRYVLYFHGPDCKRDNYAYTYPGGSVIYLCDVYFQSPTTGTDSKMDTIIHEMSHAVAYTEDYAYSMESSLDLARTSPSQAINSADNYAYFAVEANQ